MNLVTITAQGGILIEPDAALLDLMKDRKNPNILKIAAVRGLTKDEVLLRNNLLTVLEALNEKSQP